MFIDDYFSNVDHWWKFIKDINDRNEKHKNTILDLIWRVLDDLTSYDFL